MTGSELGARYGASHAQPGTFSHQLERGLRVPEAGITATPHHGMCTPSPAAAALVVDFSQLSHHRVLCFPLPLALPAPLPLQGECAGMSLRGSLLAVD